MRRLSSIYTQWWYVYLASCKPWRRYVLALSLLSVLCVAWLFAVYYPLENRRCAYEQELIQLQKQCRACSTAPETCRQLEGSIKILSASLKPYQHMDACPLVLCMELATKAGLTIHACTMATQGGQAQKEQVTLEVSGTTHAYMTFLNLLAQLPQIITYEQMHIEHTQAHQLRASCVIGFVLLR